MYNHKKKEYKESNVNYLNKDFFSLRDSLINYAKAYFPNSYKDFNETSPGMMLIEMSAYVGDVLSFYIDQQYKEMLLPLAEERRNIVKIANMLGYKVKPIVPASAPITFTQTVDSDLSDPMNPKPNYAQAVTLDKGIKIASTNDTTLFFETTDVVDFKYSSSLDTVTVAETNEDGLASKYNLTRNVMAISGETKTITFTVSQPSKFLKLSLPETNVSSIIDCVDSNGNKWYEVEYLAQDKVPVSTYYTEDTSRYNDDVAASAYNGYANESGNLVVEEIAVPYSLEYIRTGKRFIVEVNENNITSMCFGNGILKNGVAQSSEFLQTEQAGFTIPGDIQDLSNYVDPALGDVYSTLGETPNNITLTVRYRVGGGLNANTAAGTLNSTPNSLPFIGSPSSATITMTNNEPAYGGANTEDLSEIKERARAFFTTQNRCVTKEDYEARIMNLPTQFGKIAKVYVERLASGITAPGLLQPLDFDNSNQFNSEDIANMEADILTSITDGGITPELQTKLGALSTFAQTIAGAYNTSNIESNFIPTIRAHILVYDVNGNLHGNPLIGVNSPTSTVDVPDTLFKNLKTYLSRYRMITDEVDLVDGFIINFGILFDVTAQRFANKQEVKIKCINKIIDYFDINTQQFKQPIFVKDLEYELGGVDGVRNVNHITVTQDYDYQLYDNPPASFEFGGSNGLYKYSIEPSQDGVILNTNGLDGYGYKYDFKEAFEDGVIKPSVEPSVFELKNPFENVKGIVR
tara:strand:+ start:1314 stop:3557 length:2244 start_codon:yes stop_codon:yes gene_type:complete